ncbi:MAG: hypothetical protein D9V46_09980 [Deltaproteobacteria bacterium]|jgi:predicted Fe-Mo cluster-binding NifX family protein|uniref:NifB/NifX family molybdenum-iron cluster-binding protein n=1 Tax=Hydrosulfovibrio ferrireducens TaxID=2934181 RepID=UPI001218F2D3|nr:MAG: hypothetical protein D9V46_09980 [Deltaproteobacteria bacterium]
MTRKMLIPLLVVALSLFAASGALAAAGKAVIAVAAEGSAPTAQISKLAARAPYFLLFDDKGQLAEALANPYRQGAGGAGPQVVDFLAAKGIKTVIAGEFGANMTNAMKNKGMTHRTATGPAVEAVKAK